MSKPTLVVINSNYPNENNKYGDVFVHSRLKHYTSHFNIHVVGWKKRMPDHDFEYEGIPVSMVNTSDKLVRKVNSFRPAALGFHFVEGWMFKRIIKPFNGPCFIWIHGGEALGWYRRLFQFNPVNPVPFIGYMARNTIQMFQMNQLIRYANKNARVKLIFISEWMRKITETDTAIRVAHPMYIPNPIDAQRFAYREKSVEHRKNILLIRSFDSKKYANDLAMKAILLLSGKSFFHDITFTIYGVGKYYDPLTRPLAKFPNVRRRNEFLENKDIPSLHRENGVFLCPTRQDAQGVSMCEAMSSGLVVISSDNTAIPEFVTDRRSGLLTNSAAEIAGAIEYLYHHPEEYLKLSVQGAEDIRAKSSTETVVGREVSLIMETLNKYIEQERT